MTGVEVVHTFHGIPNEPGLGGRLRHFVDQLLGMTRFIPVFGSETEKQRALEKRLISTEHDAMILDSAIDLAKFPKRKQALFPFCSVDLMRPETHNRIRIGAFLRVESTRGHDLFLKVAAEAAGQGQWSCAGYPRERLGKFGNLHESLEVVGPVQDIGKWLNSLDVFVSTSTGDGQIYGALQAMAAGCICLLSNVPAHQAFVKHQAALLFDPADPKSLAQAINDVRSNKALRDMLLGNARYMLERFHNEETFRNKLLDSYRQAAKRTAKA
jgi:glycosyltransferase involved in cell wall biosynthesis